MIILLVLELEKIKKKFFTFSQKDDYGYMIFGLFKYFVDIFFG